MSVCMVPLSPTGFKLSEVLATLDLLDSITYISYTPSAVVSTTV